MGKRKRSGSFSRNGDGRKSDEGESVEEQDFDSLARANIPNGVRCSARVQEKQEKLRRESSPSKQIIEVGNPIVGTSAGVVKPLKQEDLSSTTPYGETQPIVQNVGNEEKKKKRTWELWSHVDKQLFFEALNEYGKDFEAIQSYLSSKLKSKSKVPIHCVTKNKDQVRHFYYRTWNKISKYLKFPKEMKKAYQELYGLVNFGELRKRHRVLNSKTAAKLSELVEKGTATIKVRGKTIRLRTPVCRALKRLNRIEDVEQTRVPMKLDLELSPKDWSTWNLVQAVSHNPRVKVSVPMQRTLASVITFFEDRWKSLGDRMKEEMSLTISGIQPARLRFVPQETSDICIPVFKVLEATSSAKISLRAYQENILSSEPKLDKGASKKCLKRTFKTCGTPESVPGTSQGSSSWLLQNDQTDHVSDYVSDLDTECVPKSGALHCSLETNYGDELEGNANTGATETDVDDFDTGIDESSQIAEKSDGANISCGQCGSKKKDTKRFVSHSWTEDQVKRGWTAEEAGVMTIGELYLILGQPEKLVFKYNWDFAEQRVPTPVSAIAMITRLQSVLSSMKKRKQLKSKSSASTSSCTKCEIKDELTTAPFPPPSLTKSTSTQTCPNDLCVQGTQTTTTPNIENNATILLVDSQSSICHPSPPPPIVVVNDMAAVDSSSSCEQQLMTVGTICPDNETSSTLRTTNSSAIPLSEVSSSSSPCELAVSTAALAAMCTNVIMTSSNSSSSTPENATIVGELVGEITLAGDVIMTVSNLCGDSEANVATTNQNTAAATTTTLVHTNVTDPVDISLGATSTSCTQPPPSVQLCNSLVKEVSLVAGNVQSDFRQPVSIRPRSSGPEGSSSSNKKVPPKPFIDLPKGNRRLGRRPNWKRVVVPRVLPLLPKPPAPSSGSGGGNVVVSPSSSSPTAVFPVVVTADGRESVVTTSTLCGDSSDTTCVNVMSTVSCTGVSVPSMTGVVTPLMSSSSGGVNGSKSELEKRTCDGGEKLDRNIVEMMPQISVNACDFDDLLKMRRSDESNSASVTDIDNLSMSSFMEISLPESTRFAAQELAADLDADLENSNSSLSLCRIFNSTPSPSKNRARNVSLETPKKISPSRDYVPIITSSPPVTPLVSLTDNQWGLSDPGEFSLNCLFNLESARTTSLGMSEISSDVNFQTMMGEGSGDFVTHFGELTSQVNGKSKE